MEEKINNKQRNQGKGRGTNQPQGLGKGNGQVLTSRKCASTRPASCPKGQGNRISIKEPAPQQPPTS